MTTGLREGSYRYLQVGPRDVPALDGIAGEVTAEVIAGVLGVVAFAVAERTGRLVRLGGMSICVTSVAELEADLQEIGAVPRAAA